MTRPTEETPNEEAAEMARILARMAAEERAVVEAAAQLDDASGLDRVEQTLAREWNASPPATRASDASITAQIVRLLTLAAAVVLAVVFWPREPAGPGPGEQLLGDVGLQLLLPTDGELALPTLDVIAWSHPSPAGLGFRLTVLDPDGAGPDAVLFVSARLDSLSWWDAAEVASWPRLERYAFLVEALDASGEIVDSARASARLSR